MDIRSILEQSAWVLEGPGTNQMMVPANSIVFTGTEPGDVAASLSIDDPQRPPLPLPFSFVRVVSVDIEDIEAYQGQEPKKKAVTYPPGEPYENLVQWSLNNLFINWNLDPPLPDTPGAFYPGPGHYLGIGSIGSSSQSDDFWVKFEVKIMAEDGTSDPRDYVDADTDVNPFYNTVKFKAVVTPDVPGTFIWSTTSSKITLINKSMQTVTVNAGANASFEGDAEQIKVTFTPAVASEGHEATHDLTVVHCTFTAYADDKGGIDKLVGHAWWRFGISPLNAEGLVRYLSYVNTEIGYYPESRLDVALTTGESNGKVVIGPQGDHKPVAQRTWDIPLFLLDKGLSYCFDLAKSPGTYYLRNNNCCHATIAAAASCVISIPSDKDEPTEMVDYLNGL